MFTADNKSAPTHLAPDTRDMIQIQREISIPMPSSRDPGASALSNSHAPAPRHPHRLYSETDPDTTNTLATSVRPNKSICDTRLP